MVRTLVLLAVLSGGCFAAARGRVATGPRELEATPAVEVIAPGEYGAFVTTFSRYDAMFGYGMVVHEGEWPIIPHVGGLWRIDDESPFSTEMTLGGEAGVSALHGRWKLSLGVQKTWGEVGSTGGFLSVGVNATRLIDLACGCL